MAHELSLVERHLYQRLFVRKQNANEVKRAALGEFGITGRQYNAVLFGLKGRVLAAKESRVLHLGTLQPKRCAITLSNNDLATTSSLCE